MPSLIQPALPGLPPTPKRRRALSHARVWADPAVVASRAATDRAVGDWRRSFAAFVAGLPPDRREELRRRLGVDGQAGESSAPEPGRAARGDETPERAARPGAPTGGLCPPHHWVLTTAYVDGVA